MVKLYPRKQKENKLNKEKQNKKQNNNLKTGEKLKP
jgi:hypothetical protein